MDQRTRMRGAACGTLILAVMTVIAMMVPAPYVVQSAGPTVNVLGQVDGEEVLSIEGAPGARGDGELRLTTVAVQGSPGNAVHLPSVFLAWFDPTQAVVPVEALYPDTSDVEGTRLMNTVQMNSSQREAMAVALERLGVGYSKNVVVGGVRTDGPAHEVIEAGDVLLEVNGKSFTTTAQYADAVAQTPKGSNVEVKLERNGTIVEASITPTRQDERALLGIVLAQGFEFPLDIRFAVEGIGGPSAGMIFALAVYDEMVPDDLTGGYSIAGTGTMSEDGSVGAIGGVRQKMVGAAHDGAEFFLAPAANCSQVVGHVPEGLSVVSVSTFDDALAALEHISVHGNTEGLPTC